MGETLSIVQQIMKRKDGDLRNESEDRIDVDKPLWSQDTYFGRWMHYAFITDCRTVLVPTSKLWEAKKLCEDYKWVAIFMFWINLTENKFIIGLLYKNNICLKDKI